MADFDFTQVRGFNNVFSKVPAQALRLGDTLYVSGKIQRVKTLTPEILLEDTLENISLLPPQPLFHRFSQKENTLVLTSEDELVFSCLPGSLPEVKRLHITSQSHAVILELEPKEWQALHEVIEKALIKAPE